MSKKEDMPLGKGLDVGTAFCACCYRTEDGKERYRFQRDCFLDIEAGDEAKKMLIRSDANFIESQDGSNIYVIGEDAITFANILSGARGVSKDKKTLLRRPMSSGVLNPDEPELAFQIMKEILRNLLQEPREEGEVVAYSVPAKPVDADFNIMYHQRMIETIVKSLGYSPKPTNEGLAVVYAENPQIESEDEGTIPFSGIGMSFGGGMVNICFAYKGYPLVEFSVADAYGMGEGSGGDWIDAQVSKTRSDLSISKVTKFKEKYADFTKDPMQIAEEISTNPRDIAKNTELLIALDIYYRKLVEYVLVTLGKEFAKQSESVDDPIEIVVAGGTSSPNGFEQLVMDEVSKLNLPFEIKGVRKSVKPMNTVSNGCLVAALS
jgi:hypothetical protein